MDANRQYLDTVELDPPVAAKSSIIWLHGLGADGHDFEPVVPELGLPPELGARFVFPHAPQRPVSINAGFVMRAWYDIRDVSYTRDEDEEAIRQSGVAISDLVQRERDRGIPSSRIVLAGFSQGGAIALHAGLRYPERLAGIAALSCYLVLSETLAAEASEANRSVPMFVAHGSLDPLVPMALGEASREKLEGLGYAIEWHDYPMVHCVCLEEMRDIGAWLRTVLE